LNGACKARSSNQREFLHRSSEEVLVTLTALVPFLEERLEAWARGGFGYGEGAEVEAAISEG